MKVSLIFMRIKLYIEHTFKQMASPKTRFHTEVKGNSEIVYLNVVSFGNIQLHLGLSQCIDKALFFLLILLA